MAYSVGCPETQINYLYKSPNVIELFGKIWTTCIFSLVLAISACQPHLNQTISPVHFHTSDVTSSLPPRYLPLLSCCSGCVTLTTPWWRPRCTRWRSWCPSSERASSSGRTDINSSATACPRWVAPPWESGGNGYWWEWGRGGCRVAVSRALS